MTGETHKFLLHASVLKPVVSFSDMGIQLKISHSFTRLVGRNGLMNE